MVVLAAGQKGLPRAGRDGAVPGNGRGVAPGTGAGAPSGPRRRSLSPVRNPGGWRDLGGSGK